MRITEDGIQLVRKVFPLHVAAWVGNSEDIKREVRMTGTIIKKSNIEQPFRNDQINFDRVGIEIAGKVLIVNAGEANRNYFQEGAKPLHFAVLGGKVENVSTLLNAGANVNSLDDEETTPFYYSCMKDYSDIAVVLFHSGADVNKAEHNGFTPLIIAVQNGFGLLVYSLLEVGADPTAQTRKGNTALHWAVQTLDIKYVVELLNAKGPKGRVDVNARGEKGFTPLITAASFGRADVCELLLAAGADKTLCDEFGDNAFDSARKSPASPPSAREVCMRLLRP